MAEKAGERYLVTMALPATKVVLEGDLADVGLPDLVQMLCLAGNSRELDVTVGSRHVGRLTVGRGQVLRCVAFGLTDLEAFYHLAQQAKGRYVVRIVPEPSEASVHPKLASTSWQSLLMECARQHDSSSGVRAVAESARPPSSGEGLRFSSVPPAKERKETSDIRVSPHGHVAPGPVSVASSASSASRTAAELPVRDLRDSRARVDDPPSSKRIAPSPASRPNAYVGLLQERATEAYLRQDLREALRLFECSLSIVPDDARTITNVARIKAKLGI